MQARAYRVKAGDSLSSIAKHELGRAVFWPRIYAYNNRSALTATRRLTHADRLRVGQTILLPPTEPAHTGTIAAKLQTGQPNAQQATRPAVQEGLKRSYISDMERGTRNPTLKAVERLAIAPDVGPAELMRLPEAAELTEKSPLKKG